MSAPKYSSKYYDSAAAKYEELAKRYTGQNAYRYTTDSANLAHTQAKQAAESEGAAAQNLALNAGYSRARAAREGAAAEAASYRNQYGDSYNSNLSNITNSNNAALQAQANLMQGAQAKDQNRYTSDSNRYGAAMGAVGGLFTGAANALSDENAKDIKDSSDSTEKRRCELLGKLRVVR